MSSFLKPDADVFGRYRKKGADAKIVATEKVPVDRLDTLAKADGIRPDVIKVDTQGSEMLVLQGAEKSLSTVLVAEIEVSFLRRYVGQPVFAEIEAWMTERDFELVELHKLKRYRAANSLGIRQPAPSNKNWMYFPESNCPFYRVTYLSNYSPEVVPDAATHYSLLCETS